MVNWFKYFTNSCFKKVFFLSISWISHTIFCCSIVFDTCATFLWIWNSKKFRPLINVREQNTNFLKQIVYLSFVKLLFLVWFKKKLFKKHSRWNSDYHWWGFVDVANVGNTDTKHKIDAILYKFIKKITDKFSFWVAGRRQMVTKVERWVS